MLEGVAVGVGEVVAKGVPTASINEGSLEFVSFDFEGEVTSCAVAPLLYDWRA